MGACSALRLVEIEPAITGSNPAPLIHVAFNMAAPELRFQILLSAHGVALLHFGSPAAREMAMLVQLFQIQGTTIKLCRVEDTDDCSSGSRNSWAW